MNERPNNTDTKWMGAGLMAAFVASLCCVTPIFAFLAGIGGVDGVLEADASYDTGKATIIYDHGKTARKVIIAAINKTGFTVNQKSNN